ncbi:EutP/PduV family microcompartment system protein [Alkaliphilus peptidifermentans]|uniref:Ethanolamine utilization protein EutP n=1 Tax=Alkaliphilus peptidifermentans DSM 18978 TaxID=1120976 RepID=A0A1G5KUK8_9FIRM|nr:EutP/PduV family microcompartment system protein [Alkaliphilus peptidifermentans]SCZ04292.1 ethanolamine utilization protein EutP [Alkaliphilus peptidifermentans DSM 18978]
MKKVILVGRSNNGKTSLSQKLNQQELAYKKTQTMEFSNHIIDTPGEYIENRRYYHAIISASVDCDVIGLLQAANEPDCIFPPGFGNFFNKPVIGIITKIDLERDTSAVEKILYAAGAQRIFRVSSVTTEGIKEITAYIEEKEY